LFESKEQMMSRSLDPLLLTLAISLPGASHALGLGEIHVDSQLNQPLSAQIDIVGASSEELAGLRAAVANPAAFKTYGADRPTFLSSTSFKVGHDGSGRPVLEVRSSEDFTEPVVSLVVDLNWGSGELVREYTLLLDPVIFASGRAASPQLPGQPADIPRAAISPAGDRKAALARRAVPDANPPKFPVTNASGTYTVVANDTLAGIARRTGAHSKSHLRRVMVAIYRANPDAFAGNINVLRRGATLQMPSNAAVSAISKEYAKREIRAQMAAWRSGGVAAQRTGTAAASAVASAPAGSAISSAASTAAASNANLDASSPAALEFRIKALEQALDETNRMVAQKHAQVIELQEQLTRAAAQPAAPSPAALATSALAGASPATAAPATAAATVPPHPKMFLQPVKPPPAHAPVPASAATQSGHRLGHVAAIGSGVVALLLLAAFAVFRIRLLRRAAKGVPAGNWHSTRIYRGSSSARGDNAQMGDDLLLDDAQAAHTLGIDDEIQGIREKTDAAAQPHLPAPLRAQSAAGATPRRAASSNATVEIDMQTETHDFSSVDLETVETHVLLPSGLNDQTVFHERRTSPADVLKQAIAREPGRQDLRLKLLELYYAAAASNRQAFLDVAHEFAVGTSHEPSGEWSKVANMGREIAADNALFSGASAAEQSGDAEHPGGNALKDCA
jgi:pilus assembly protein FimV